MRTFINIVEGRHLIEIERGGELGDDKHWGQVQKADVDSRQSELFPDDGNDYDLQGHFDGLDVATMNPDRVSAPEDAHVYVLFRASTPIAYITLKSYSYSYGEHDYQVSAIRIAHPEQGKGLAPRFYRWLLTDGHINRLYADDNQTDGGAKIWERLLRLPGIAVFIAPAKSEKDGRRVKTLASLNKVWQSDAYCLYATALSAAV